MRSPSIPRPLARRLDRLSRAAHRFHRYAHHPLCAEYERELFRCGKMRVCKGCALAALGAAAGTVLGLVAPGLPPRPLIALALSCALLVSVPLLRPRKPEAWPAEGSAEAAALTASHRIPPSRGKLLTRFLPCAALACLFVEGLRQRGLPGLGLALAAPLLGLAAVLIYRRRGPQRGPCATCPERFARHRCRGVQEVLRRERAFQRVSGRMLSEARQLK